MEQWVSVANCYLYGHAVPNYILKYIFAGEGGPDRAEIDSAVAALRTDYDAIDRALATGPCLAGTLSLADLFVAPMVMGASMFPERRALLGEFPNLGRHVGAMVEQPGFMASFPPQA